MFKKCSKKVCLYQNNPGRFELEAVRSESAMIMEFLKKKDLLLRGETINLRKIKNHLISHTNLSFNRSFTVL